MPKHKTAPRMPQRSATVAGRRSLARANDIPESAAPAAPSNAEIAKRAQIKKRKK
jgi:hypothetical protein